MDNEIITFGCRLNAFESEVIKNKLIQSNQHNTMVFNTCAVTKEAERQARQAIRKARRQYPEKQIIVTGCSAQINADHYAKMPEVDMVLGNEEKLDARYYQPDHNSKVRVNDIMSVKETASHLIASFEGKARAFVQIQNGCNHRCTFCIIPYGRGNSRSVPMGKIVEQVQTLVDSGYNEVVLTGVDLTDYGSDLPGKPSLGQMIKRLLALVPQLPRLRLSSIDVAEIDSQLMQLIADESRLMPHLHISLQAGDNMILKRMKRRHSREDVLTFCENVRRIRKDVAFGADMIAGFPTENDQMFNNSLALVHEARLQYLHVFPYSQRKGTPAAKMPQMPVSIRKERALRLREAGDKERRLLANQMLGSTQHALVETSTKARAENFAEITLDKPQAVGSIISVLINQVNDKTIYGQAL